MKTKPTILATIIDHEIGLCEQVSINGQINEPIEELTLKIVKAVKHKNFEFKIEGHKLVTDVKRGEWRFFVWDWEDREIMPVIFALKQDQDWDV